MDDMGKPLVVMKYRLGLNRSSYILDPVTPLGFAYILFFIGPDGGNVPCRVRFVSE
jgi:hypothetical protein